MLLIYRILINVAFIFSPFIFLIRIIKKKENNLSVKQKLGFANHKRRKGRVIWFHGASVGEILSVIPLIEKYEKSKIIDQILITSNTLSSSKIIKNYNFKKITHQFFPIDNQIIIKKFINYWQPSLALFIDSEVWPNMLIYLNKKKIPSVLLNARITKKSFNRWIKFRKFSKLIFSKFEICLSSNSESVNYLKKLGAKKIKYFGNLKYSQSENEKINIDKRIISFFRKKRVWCASSTHFTEEKFAGLLHIELKKKFKNLLTVIIPRHIHRENEIKEQLIELDLKVHTHSDKIKIDNDTDIYLVNTFGRTKFFYSIISNVFLGGSLIKHGGQNPLEAIRYNCNVLHGPYIENFNEIFIFLHNQKVADKITNLNQASIVLKRLLSSKKTKKNIKNKIKNIGEKILNKNMSEIKSILNKV